MTTISILGSEYSLTCNYLLFFPSYEYTCIENKQTNKKYTLNALKCINLECRIDKDADGRITVEEIKEVWNHNFTTKGTQISYQN